MHKTSFALIGLFSLIWGCQNMGTSSSMDEEIYAQLTKKGMSISNKAQLALFQNVSNAMQKGGSEYAIEFCNVAALSLTDSVAQSENVKISRVSERNRNPINTLNEKEQALWNHYQKHWEQFKFNDTLVQQNGQNIYYKPIPLGIPTCLKCHGTTTDIDSATLTKINHLYPNDKATGFKMGELRGFWKIEF